MTEREYVCVFARVRACVCVFAYVCVRVYVPCKSVSAFVRVCVRVVSRASNIFTRMRMHVRKWEEGGKEKTRLSRPSRFLWQPGMRLMSSTCT